MKLVKSCWMFAVVAACLSPMVGAQTYPFKPITMIVPYPPGGGAEIPARVVVPTMQAALGQQITIETRPGAGGTIGGNLAAKAAPDGYTLLFTDSSTTVDAPALYSQLPYDPAKDFVIAGTVLKTYFAIIAGPGWKGANIKELIDESKANPKKLSIAIGPAVQVVLGLFMLRMGADVQPVLYKGAALAIQDVLGAHVPLALFGANTAAPLVKQGKIRVLAITSKTRQSAFPGVPALSETYPDYESLGWLGVYAPAGTPHDIVVRLNAAINAALRDPAVIKRFDEFVSDVFPKDVEEARGFWHAQMALWPDVIRRLGIKAN